MPVFLLLQQTTRRQLHQLRDLVTVGTARLQQRQRDLEGGVVDEGEDALLYVERGQQQQEPGQQEQPGFIYRLLSFLCDCF